MLNIAEQQAFIAGALNDIGNYLGLPNFADPVLALVEDGTLKCKIEEAVADEDFFRTKDWDSLLRFGLYRLAQYGFVRSLGCRRAIETGVLHGLTTIFILQGLKDNKAKGQLISIDLPSTFEDGPSNVDGFTDTLPPRRNPGWVVGDDFKEHWTLRIGRSTEHINAAVQSLGGLDMFLHDSDHTYETMMDEFEMAWPHLEDGGILVADNISCNPSFFDFCIRVNRVPYVAPVDPDHVAPNEAGIRFGLIRK